MTIRQPTPNRSDNEHRQTKIGDSAIDQQRRDEARLAALDELAEQAQASGGYDAPAQFGPRRPR
jgi:hypothetical protein